MTLHFNCHPRWCSGGNQSVRSLVSVVSRWLWRGNRTILEVASMVVTWWIGIVLHSAYTCNRSVLCVYLSFLFQGIWATGQQNNGHWWWVHTGCQGKLTVRTAAGRYIPRLIIFLNEASSTRDCSICYPMYYPMKMKHTLLVIVAFITPCPPSISHSWSSFLNEAYSTNVCSIYYPMSTKHYTSTDNSHGIILISGISTYEHEVYVYRMRVQGTEKPNSFMWKAIK